MISRTFPLQVNGGKKNVSEPSSARRLPADFSHQVGSSSCSSAPTALPHPAPALNCASPGVPRPLQGGILGSRRLPLLGQWAHLPGQGSQVSVLCLVSFQLYTCHSYAGGCLVVQTGALLISGELSRNQGDDCESKKGGSEVRQNCVQILTLP